LLSTAWQARQFSLPASGCVISPAAGPLATVGVTALVDGAAVVAVATADAVGVGAATVGALCTVGVSTVGVATVVALNELVAVGAGVKASAGAVLVGVTGAVTVSLRLTVDVLVTVGAGEAIAVGAGAVMRANSGASEWQWKQVAGAKLRWVGGAGAMGLVTAWQARQFSLPIRAWEIMGGAHVVVVIAAAADTAGSGVVLASTSWVSR
jgi:hypothetical protein